MDINKFSFSTRPICCRILESQRARGDVSASCAGLLSARSTPSRALASTSFAVLFDPRLSMRFRHEIPIPMAAGTFWLIDSSLDMCGSLNNKDIGHSPDQRARGGAAKLTDGRLSYERNSAAELLRTSNFAALVRECVSRTQFSRTASAETGGGRLVIAVVVVVSPTQITGRPAP